MAKTFKQNEWFAFLWLLNTDHVTVFTGIKATSTTLKPKTDNKFLDNLIETFSLRFIQAFMFITVECSMSLFLLFIKIQRWLSPKKTEYAVGSDAISKNIDPQHWAWNLETEFFFPIKFLPEFIVRMRQYVQLLEQNRTIPAAPMMGFRFIKGDNTYLSPAYIHKGYDEFVAVSVFDTNKRTTQSPYLLGVKGLIEDIVKDKKLVRMHVGKVYLDRPEDFHKRFAHWQTFSGIQKYYDPQGIFLNPWTSRFFQ